MENLAYNIPDGYNSDDAASEDEPVSYRQGLRAIGEIFKNALENKTSSKKTLKNHRAEAAAPGTAYKKRCWYNMFMAFFETLNLP
jgi:hypothetical protein